MNIGNFTLHCAMMVVMKAMLISKFRNYLLTSSAATVSTINSVTMVQTKDTYSELKCTYMSRSMYKLTFFHITPLYSSHTSSSQPPVCTTSKPGFLHRNHVPSGAPRSGSILIMVMISLMSIVVSSPSTCCLNTQRVSNESSRILASGGEYFETMATVHVVPKTTV